MAEKSEYDLNDIDYSKTFRNYVKRHLDKDPLRRQICDKVDEFNKCECPKTRNKLRKEIEKLDGVRRQRDIEKLR